MRIVCLISATMMLSSVAPAQFASGSWTTFGGDPQRTGWARGERDLKKDNIAGLKLEWSLTVNNQSKELNALTIPLVRGPLITTKGFKEVVVVAGSANKLFVIDSDTGKVFWEKPLEVTPPGTSPYINWLCPNALNATPVIGPFPAPRGSAPATGSASFRGQAIYVLAADGKLHGYNIMNGESIMPPTQFTPPYSKNWSLNLVDGKVYTTTAQGCGGARSGVWSLDLNDPNRKVSTFFAATRPGGNGIWGRGGAAMTSDGKFIVETGDGAFDPATNNLADSIVAVDKDLKLIDYYTPTNRGWITKKDLDMGNMSAVVFKYKTWELIAGSGKEGVIYLLDSKSMGGADHRTPLFRSPLWTNEEVNFAARGFWGAMSTWENEAGTRYLLAPAWGPPTAAAKFPTSYGAAPDGSLMAFKVEVVNEKPVLVPAWQSLNMKLPTPPVIANGMIFVIADGDSPSQVKDAGGLLSSEDRAKTSSPAKLYVLDGETGKVLWSSGETIKSFSHFSAPVVSGGRVYVTTYDNTIYAFSLGVPSER